MQSLTVFIADRFVNFCAIGIAVGLSLMSDMPAVADEQAAGCDFCSPKVVLDARRALCFMEIYEERLRNLDDTSKGLMRIDLESCPVRTRGVFDNGKVPGVNTRKLGRVVFLDNLRISCLEKIISETSIGFDPSRVFVLKDVCK